MLNRLNNTERRHLARVKELPCSVCGEPGPSSAHHTKQGNQYTCIALCYDCHQGPSGWHGTRQRWKLYKMDENDALNETLRGLM